MLPNLSRNWQAQQALALQALATSNFWLTIWKYEESTDVFFVWFACALYVTAVFSCSLLFDMSGVSQSDRAFLICFLGK